MELNNYGIFIGRLVKDITLLDTTSSNLVKAKVNLAVEREYMSQEKKKLAKQENKPTSDFPHNLVVYGDNALRWIKWFRKGDLVQISYAVRNWNYEDNNGKKIYMEEKVIERMRLRNRPNSNTEHSNSNQQNNSYSNNNQGVQGNNSNAQNFKDDQFQAFKPINGDDDIPF